MGTLHAWPIERWHVDSLNEKNLMKKHILSGWWLALGLLLVNVEVSAQTKSVSILSYQKDESSLAMIEGVHEVLKSAGFRDGRNLKLRVVDAQADPEQAQQLALEMVRGRPDVIVSLSLAATQAVVLHTKQIPVVFAGITDPVTSEVVLSMGPSGTNITGVSDALSIQKRVALIKQLSPKARRVGVLYNPADASSVAQVREFQENLSGTGLIAIEITVLRPVDVGSAARSLIEKVDVFQTLTDRTVSQGYASLVQVANDARIPLVGWDVNDVRAGAVAAVDLTDLDIGTAAGRLTLRILRGTKPGAIAPEIIANPPIYTNLQAAAKQTVTFTPVFLKASRPLVQ